MMKTIVAIVVMLSSVAVADPFFEHGTTINGFGGGVVTNIDVLDTFWTYHRLDIEPDFDYCEYRWFATYDGTKAVPVDFEVAGAAFDFGPGSFFDASDFGPFAPQGCSTCTHRLEIQINDVSPFDAFTPLQNSQTFSTGRQTAQMRILWQMQDPNWNPNQSGETRIIANRGGRILGYASNLCQNVVYTETFGSSITYVPEPASGGLLAGVALLLPIAWRRRAAALALAGMVAPSSVAAQEAEYSVEAMEEFAVCTAIEDEMAQMLCVVEWLSIYDSEPEE